MSQNNSRPAARRHSRSQIASARRLLWWRGGIAAAGILLAAGLSGCGHPDLRAPESESGTARQLLPDETKQLRTRADIMVDPSGSQSAVAGDLLKRGQQKEAEEGFRRALDWNPANVDALVGLAMVRAGVTSAEAAAKLAKEARPGTPEARKLQPLIGMSLLRAGQVAKAAPLLESALDRNPTDQALLFAAALCQARMQHWAQAEAHCNRAIALFTAKLDQQNQTRKSDNQPLLKEGTDLQGVRVLLGTLYLQQKKGAQAAAQAQILLKNAPDDPREFRPAVAHELLARAYMVQGQRKQALAAIAEARKRQPRWLESYVDGGLIHLQAKEYDEAVKDFRIALALSPGCLPAALGGAEACLAGGREGTAVVAYERVMKINPRQYDALNNLAYLYAQMGIKLDRATTIAEQLAKGNPKSGALQDTLGWVYCRAGRHQDAVKPLQTAAGLAPKDGVVRYHLGVALAGVGEKSQARDALRAALSLGMPPDEAQDARARLASL